MGAAALVAGDLVYYLYRGVYYRRINTGYIVVEPPAATVSVREVSPVIPSSQDRGEKASVTVHVLNVRSGPGMGFPVTSQVREGDRLAIQGYAPEWLYVKTSAGGFGWVMQRHTSRLSAQAGG